MIYTSYFSKVASLPKTAVPISIARIAPKWFDGPEYKLLALDYRLLQDWKRDHNEEHYEKWFNKMLALIEPEKLVKEWEERFPGKDIVLLCYEKPGDFCHRHLVAEWLLAYGIDCEEWNFNNPHLRLYETDTYDDSEMGMWKQRRF